MNATYDGPRLALDFDALAHNWRTVCAAGMGQPVGAVVKNDAYGLGVAAVVPQLWALGCREFWVATLHEALAVRHSLRDAAAGAARILVLNGLAGTRPEDFAAQGLTPVTMDRFRANLVLDGIQAYDEDHLDEITIDAEGGPGGGVTGLAALDDLQWS